MYVTLFALAALCNVIGGASINVQCEPSSNNASCLIGEPIHFNAADRLVFNNMTATRADRVLELSVSYYAKITLIPVDIFKTFAYLEQLKLQGVELKYVHHSDFDNAWNLFNLTLSDNKLDRIGSATFSRAVNLIELNLDGNDILHLENDAFNGLHQLYSLSLNRNRLITLKQFAFAGAPHLTDLRLEHNNIVELEDGVFDLPDLQFLYIAHNQLKTLADDCFKNTQLIGLDLQSNQITQLSNAVYLKTLRTLILLDNPIEDLNVTRIADLNQLVDFKYDRNIRTVV